MIKIKSPSVTLQWQFISYIIYVQRGSSKYMYICINMIFYIDREYLSGVILYLIYPTNSNLCLYLQELPNKYKQHSTTPLDKANMKTHMTGSCFDTFALMHQYKYCMCINFLNSKIRFIDIVFISSISAV